MPAYSKTPLPKKLGIKPGGSLLLLGAPEGFQELLGAGIADVRVRTQCRGASDLVMLFCGSAAELKRRLPAAKRAMAEGGSIWLAWPKKASGVATDLSDGVARETGLAAGLVDFKVASIDDTWSGLRFARRKAKR